MDQEKILLLQKGAGDDNFTDGLVLADCARFINNGIAIKGEDLELKVDAFENCNDCPAGELAPNHFLGAKIFEVCYVDRDVPLINATGNYWGGVDPGTMTSGCIGTGTTVPVDNAMFVTEALSCNGFNGPQTPTFPTETSACEIDDEQINETTYDLFHKGYSYFRNEMFEESYAYFQTVGQVSQLNRNSSSTICKHYIDVSRALPNLTNLPDILQLSKHRSLWKLRQALSQKMIWKKWC